MTLTAENYNSGFLIDDELMGAVTKTPEGFASYVLNYATGEYLGYLVFETLEEALFSISQVKRPWKYESTKSCGGGNCSSGGCSGGKCSTGGCSSKKRKEQGCAH